MVQWEGGLYLEDGLHRALRAALQQRTTIHARVPLVTVTARSGRRRRGRRTARRYAASGGTSWRPPLLDLLDLDRLHSDEELEIRASSAGSSTTGSARTSPTGTRRATLPARELAAEFGKLGLLGMHLNGYGCAGASAVAYGLACMELEAGDSGVRILVSVQGSLAMYAIWRFGSRGAEAALAARGWRPARRSAASA